jgi:hypothetical protein
LKRKMKTPILQKNLKLPLIYRMVFKQQKSQSLVSYWIIVQIMYIIVFLLLFRIKWDLKGQWAFTKLVFRIFRQDLRQTGYQRKITIKFNLIAGQRVNNQIFSKNRLFRNLFNWFKNRIANNTFTNLDTNNKIIKILKNLNKILIIKTQIKHFNSPT